MRAKHLALAAALKATLISEICDTTEAHHHWRPLPAPHLCASYQLSLAVERPSFSRANVALAQYGFVAWLSKGRDAMKVPDYIAIGVLVVLFVWAAAGQFPRDKL